jgi:hypothetical protein
MQAIGCGAGNRGRIAPRSRRAERWQVAIFVDVRLGGRMKRLTNRWSGRVIDKMPSPYIGVRAAQLNR